MVESREERYTREDRDLLVVTNATVLSIKEDIKELKNNVVSRVSLLENTKANEAEICKIYDTRNLQWKEFGSRIESLENWKNWILGIFTIIGIVVSLVVYIYFHDMGSIQKSVETNTDKIQDLIIKIK